MEDLQDITNGESKNIEYKVQLPSNSEKYMKSIVAFANTQGGRLVIGIDDETREIVGVDTSTLFDTMDAIASAVSDSCEPAIFPDIEPKTIDGKTVIVVTVEPGSHRPYYIKSKGRDSGTFVRIGATSRPASMEKIRELEREGSNVSWDELPCIGYKVSNKSISILCDAIKNYRKDAGLQERKVDVSQLINWKLIKEEEEGYIASNAFVLLTSDYFQFSKIQCAVFKGTDRAIFVDKREYSGPVYEQFEEAMDFVKRNIRLSATITPTVRKEEYELPMNAVREMILNAICHRDYLDESCIQVAIYDDRLEVTSPGGLYFGLTLDEMMNGRSRLRNRALANVFSQMGLIESWGTGMQRIFNEAENAHLKRPDVEAYDSMVRINLYRDEKLQGKPGEISIGISDQPSERPTKRATNQASDQPTKRPTNQEDEHEIEEKMQELLQFCVEPKSRKEIQEFLGYKNRGYVRSKIIKPLLEDNKLKMTMPDKPNISTQKYVAVVKN